MKAHALSLCSFLLISVSAVAVQEDDIKKELAKMEGAWQVASGVEDGQPSPDRLVEIVKFVFKGDKLTLTGDDKLMKIGPIGLKIDPSTTPKCIDLKIETGELKDTAFEGIYECKGDELKLCVIRGTGNRPLEFESKAGSNRVLFVLKRVKSENNGSK
jgi:uncharacterized protein (TIGR03067 family)